MPPMKTALKHLKLAVSEMEKIESEPVKPKVKSVGTSPMKSKKVKSDDELTSAQKSKLPQSLQDAIVKKKREKA